MLSALAAAAAPNVKRCSSTLPVDAKKVIFFPSATTQQTFGDELRIPQTPKKELGAAASLPPPAR